MSSNVIADGNININAGSFFNSHSIIDEDQGNLNVIASNIISTQRNIDLKSSGDTNIIAASNSSSFTTLAYNFDLAVQASVGQNISGGLRNLKDVTEINPVSAIGGTLNALDKLVLNGDSLNESLQGNENDINNLSKDINSGIRAYNAAKTPVTAGISISLNLAGSRSSESEEVYQNSLILATNGSLTSTSLSDTNIRGANLVAQDTTINTRNNLNIESKQNHSTSSSASFNVNADIALIGNTNAINVGFNVSNAKRNWVDDVTSVVGTNSLTINVGNNTDVKGALVANISNYVNADGSLNTNQNSWVDQGNLNVTTRSLSYSDIEDTDKMTSFGLSVGTSNVTPASGALNYAARDIEQSTRATIGKGTIKTGDDVALTFDDATNELTAVAGGTENNSTHINRDVNNAQIITKNIDLTPITVEYTRVTDRTWREAKGDYVQIGDTLAIIPGSPVWVSRYIDANNDEVDKDTGGIILHPAPNLFTGNFFDNSDVPSVGRGDIECKNSSVCRMSISDEAYHLRALYYGLPGFKSFSQFHDSQMVNADGTEKGGAYKFFSIFPFIPANYYGAVGTIFDARNWSQNNSNSNSTIKNDK